MYQELIGKLASPGASAIGREVERIIEAHLLSAREHHLKVRDVMVSYYNFDWLKHGPDFWEFFKSQQDSRTVVEVANYFKELAKDLKKHGKLNNLFKGRFISSRRYSDNMRGLVENEILSTWSWSIRGTILIGIFYAGVQLYNMADTCEEIFSKGYACPVEELSFGIIASMFVFVTAMLIGILVSGNIYQSKLTKIGWEFYRREVLPCLIDFIRERKI